MVEGRTIPQKGLLLSLFCFCPDLHMHTMTHTLNKYKLKCLSFQ